MLKRVFRNKNTENSNIPQTKSNSKNKKSNNDSFIVK